MFKGERTAGVLVVDSEGTESTTTNGALEKQPSSGHFDVTHVPSLEEALDLLRAQDFEAIAISTSGEPAEGQRILEAFRSLAPSSALLARCEPLTEDVTLAMLDIGFEECLGQRVSDDEFFTSVRRAVSRHRAQRSDDLMASIIRASADTIFSVDRDGLFTSFNSGAERLFGYSAEEVIGRHVSIITSGEQTDQQRQWYLQLIKGKPIFDQWTTRTRADGSVVQVSVTSNPMFDADGEFTGICSVMRDVSGLVGARGHLEHRTQPATAADSASQVGSWEYDSGIGKISWSDEMYRLWGLDPSSGPVSPPMLLEMIHVDDRDQLTNAAARWLRSPGTAIHHACRVITPDGQSRTLLITGQHVPSSDGSPGKLHGTAIDISDPLSQQADEIQIERQFQRSFKDSPAPMWIAELEGPLTEVNDALCDLLGRRREALVGEALAAFIHPEDNYAGNPSNELQQEGGRASITREQRFLHSDGHVIWAIVAMTLIRDVDGTPLHLIGHAQDITKRRRYEERLRHMADHDPLTGLLNRRGFDRELRRHVSHISRYGATGALLVLDLDNFKHFNDTYGHTAGDNLIASISRGLHGRLRANDVIGRLGGDEFAVLLPEADREQAEAVAVALLDYVRESPQAGAFEEGRRLTASIGILTFDGEGPFSKDRAMDAADAAMYAAKGLGRNRFWHHDPAQL